MRYEYEEEILGLDRPMLAEYDLIKGYKGNIEEPDVPDHVELVSIYLDEDGSGKFIELDSSKEYDEELCDRIMEDKHS